MSVSESNRVIELKMMDPYKYYPFITTLNVFIRCITYPLLSIKTRIQNQVGKELYSGTIDAFVKIKKHEGIRGLYRGVVFHNLQILPSLFYISTYEGGRHFLGEHLSVKSSSTKGLISGFTASLVSQTLFVPLEVVNQHMMVLSQHSTKKTAKKLIQIPEEMKKTRFLSHAIARQIWRTGGVKGFYKGYFVSLMFFAPNSALWWFSYDTYSAYISEKLPSTVPRLFIHAAISAPLAALSTSCVTNFVDVIKVNVQIDGLPVKETILRLWNEERWGMFTKGLSTRMPQSAFTSTLLIFGYESVKKLSLLEEYRDAVRW